VKGGNFVSRIVDSDDVKTIELDCNCAAVLVTHDNHPDEGDTKGVSFFFCAEHSARPNAVVYDVDVVRVHDAFAWDYAVHHKPN
jgi:hypothetical protein